MIGKSKILLVLSLLCVLVGVFFCYYNRQDDTELNNNIETLQTSQSSSPNISHSKVPSVFTQTNNNYVVPPAHQSASNTNTINSDNEHKESVKNLIGEYQV
jgi:hypothetical protein